MIARAGLLGLVVGGLLAILLTSGGGPPEDRVVGAVPHDAVGYVHVDRGSDGWRAAEAALRRLPALDTALRELVPAALVPAGKGQLGIAWLPPGRPAVFEPEDPELEPPARSLDDLSGYSRLVEALQEDRFAHAYASAEGVPALRGIDETLREGAASVAARDGLVHVRGLSRHEGAPGACSGRTTDEGLLSLAGRDTGLYLELPSVACGLRALAQHVEGAAEVVGRLAALLPLLDRRGALIAAPGEGSPVVTLVVDDIDEAEALDALAALQPVLVDLLATPALGQAPSFGAEEVDGMTVATARLAPGVELSYAAWDRRLVVSSALEGVAAVRRAEGLAASPRFEAVLADRPIRRSALLFLDLDQLLALGEQSGLAEDPRYLAIRDDLQKLRAVGAVLTRERESTTAELTFHIP